jgi:hypothetical protein
LAHHQGGREKPVHLATDAVQSCVWLILMPLLDLLAFKTNPLSLQNIVIDLVLLPVCLLGGYLEAKWRWQDWAKKYPADPLPSGE